MPGRCAGFASVPASATGSSWRCRRTIWSVDASVTVTSPTVPPPHPATAPIFADAEPGAPAYKPLQVGSWRVTRRAVGGSARLEAVPRGHRFTAVASGSSSPLVRIVGRARPSRQTPGHCLLIVQLLAVFAERLVARSRDTIVRRYPQPEPALGIGVVKSLFLGIVSWNLQHAFVLYGLAQRGAWSCRRRSVVAFRLVYQYSAFAVPIGLFDLWPNDLLAETSGQTLRSLAARCKENRREPGRDRHWLSTLIGCIVLHGRKFRSG